MVIRKLDSKEQQIEEQKVLNEMKNCCQKKINFVLEAGAGSGKTYSLITLINQLINIDRNKNIICITYTNNAAEEILSRITQNNHITVCTIHTFLWNLIKNYDYDLKKSLVKLIKRGKIKYSYDQVDINDDIFNNIEIKYDNFCSFHTIGNGYVFISHDQILLLSYEMFKDYPKLSDILIDTYPYIFIDEYQDTSKKVIDIFLNIINKNSSKKHVIGLFGDSMQSIYETGIGKLDEYPNLKKIEKKINYRNPIKIIEIANYFRCDKLEQYACSETKTGTIKLIYGKKEQTIFNSENIRKLFQSFQLIDDDDEIIELKLTNREISENLNFKQIFDIYNKNKKYNLFDPFMNKHDIILRKLDNLFDILIDYHENNIPSFLSKINYRLKNIEDKNKINNIMDFFFKKHNIVKKSIGEVLNYSFDNDLIICDDEFKNNKPEYWNQLEGVPFLEYVNFIKYQRKLFYTLTQHSTKGSQFDNIFLDLSSNWNKYNYISLFKNDFTNENVEKRTKKLFYVCLTRTQKNIIIYLPSEIITDEIKELFGSNNIHNIEHISDNLLINNPN